MIICDSIRAFNAAAVPVAAALGHLGIGQLYLAAGVEGTAFVFFNVAETAALPRVVQKSQIPLAASQNQAAQAAGALIAPPLAGLVFQTLGKAIPFLFDAVSYGASVGSLLIIRVKFQLERTAPRRSLRAEIMEGLDWLWHEPLIRYMAVLTGGLNFAGSASFLILILLAKQHGASPALIGVMFALTAVGGLLGSLVAPRFQRRFGFAEVIVTTVWIQAIAMPFMAIAPGVFVLAALAGVVYFVGPIYNAVQFSYRMAIIPDELQGRVNSAMRMLIFGLMPLGSALGGLLSQTIGAVDAILVFGSITIALAILTTLNPHIRRALPYEQVAAA
jgi:MFS family permease